MAPLDRSWAEGNADRTAAAKIEAQAQPVPAGIPPALLERCMRAKAKQVQTAQDGTSADRLVLAELETKKARERCVRSVINQHKRKARK